MTVRQPGRDISTDNGLLRSRRFSECSQLTCALAEEHDAEPSLGFHPRPSRYLLLHIGYIIRAADLTP